MPKAVQCLIDMDSLLYAASASAERSEYVAAIPDGDHGPKLMHFATRADMMLEIKDLPGTQIYERKVVGEFQVAIDRLTDAIMDCVETLKGYYGSDTRLVMHKLVGGSANFRQRLDTHIPYKHNRSNRAPPAYLERLREYSVKKLHCTKVHFWETDDELAIRGTAYLEAGTPFIIVSMDKDLLQVPGMHLVPKHGFLDQSELSAWCMVYQQAMSGDSADGVPGCPQIGEDRAIKLIETLRKAHTEATPQFHKDAWALIVKTYETAKSKKPSTFPWETAEAGALETMRLVYLLRHYPKNKYEPCLWSPK